MPVIKCQAIKHGSAGAGPILPRPGCAGIGEKLQISSYRFVGTAGGLSQHPELAVRSFPDLHQRALFVASPSKDFNVAFLHLASPLFDHDEVLTMHLL